MTVVKSDCFKLGSRYVGRVKCNIDACVVSLDLEMSRVIGLLILFY